MGSSGVAVAACVSYDYPDPRDLPHHGLGTESSNDACGLPTSWRMVEVTIPDPADNYKGVSGHLSAEIQVEEGRQWRVNTLEMEGVPDADAAYLRSILQSTAGEPFIPAIA